jgi:3-phosphoshikimate 1-carboxyvinyltransferase
LEKYLIHHPVNLPSELDIFLASSKSESNRALIINALAKGKDNLSNLSTARDTQTMIRLLQSDDTTADVLDAGTTMRFLTAYFSATNQTKTMTGTPRMCERPIGILTEALETIGVEMNHLGQKGYPPHQIKGFNNQKSNEVTIRGDVSSQYISALLMIAPTLPFGLIINLTGEIGSKPYIEMTIAQMKAFGVDVLANWEDKKLIVAPQKYIPTDYAIESDWSGASYWFTVVALSKEPISINLMGLKENSLQGDSAIVEIMDAFGVASEFHSKGVCLTKKETKKFLKYDYSNCPDLVQTVIACATLMDIELELTGIESLKIKETDRVLALQNETAKFGAEFKEIVKNEVYHFKNDQLKTAFNQTITIDTYDDHRMAMAFAPLAMQTSIIIEEPGVVAKSYPSYWSDLSKIANIETIH